MKQAVSSPLLETTIEGATDVIINISGDISLMDANDAASYVEELVGEDANIIFGAMYDDTYADEASITVIATGLHTEEAQNAGVETQKVNSTSTASSFSNPFQSRERANVSAFPKKSPAPSYSQPRPSVNPAPAAPGLNRLRTPESKIQEKDIQIPDFLRKR